MLNLEEKKQYYINKVSEIQNEDYSTEIELKLSQYRETLIAEFKNEQNKKLEKIKTYIELLDELIEDSKEDSEEDSEFIEEGEN